MQRQYSQLLPVTSDLGSTFDRVKVSVSSTGFNEGREFHFMDEFSILAGASKVIQVISPLDTVVQDLTYSIDAGHIRAVLLQGGTPGGTFATPVNIHPANSMSVGVNRRDWNPPNLTPYARQVTMFSGGSVTGGTEVEIVRLKVADNTNFASSFGSNGNHENGMGAGTFYIVIQNIGATTTTGTVKGRWEERP